MRFYLILLIFFSLQNCSKPKTVLICGDHICINKNEAEQYFEETLSIEVKVIDKKKNKEINLVELNLNNDPSENRKIIIKKRNNTKKKVKVLTDEEIKIIKENIKNKNKKKQLKNNNKGEQIVKKNPKKLKKVSKNKKKIVSKKKTVERIKNINKPKKQIVDICTIIEKCNIDEISKYLLLQGKKSKFPDITTRE